MGILSVRDLSLYTYSISVEIVAIGVCLFLYPFRSTDLDRPKKLEGKPNILCVHGYLHNDTPWGFFRKYLQKHGAGPVDTVYYPSELHDIPAHSLKIKKRIDHIRQETGKSVNILIGHSLGGLVCLEYALEHAPKDEPLYVITLGSPLKQLRTDSSYIPWLRDRLEEATHIQLLNLAGTHDLMVKPSKLSLLPELAYASCEEIEGLGHVSFLFSTRALKKIVQFLNLES